jgi:hypothetical protein
MLVVLLAITPPIKIVQNYLTDWAVARRRRAKYTPSNPHAKIEWHPLLGYRPVNTYHSHDFVTIERLCSMVFAPRNYLECEWRFTSQSATFPSHPLWLDHSNYTGWRVQVMKFLVLSKLPLVHLSSIQICSFATCFQTPSMFFPKGEWPMQNHRQNCKHICSKILRL